MDSFNCIIVDDEQNNRKSLRLLIDKFCPELKVVGEAWDMESIQSTIKTVQADVLFLDIQIGSMTIFDILEDEDVLNHHVVMVTAYSEFSLKSYDLHAIDYLLKPVNSLDLRRVVKKISAPKSVKNIPTTSFSQIKDIHAQKSQDSKLSLSDSKGIHIIDISEILYCKASGNYTTLFFENGGNKMFSKKLKYFEEKLLNHEFFRVYKSYLINLQFVKSISNDDGGSVHMSNDVQIPISRFKKKELLERIDKFTL